MVMERIETRFRDKGEEYVTDKWYFKYRSE